MRHLRPALVALIVALTTVPALAQPPVPFEDAGIHAVQFVDKDEGWAGGDDGVIWHSIDGGKTWERQKTGTRASLRSVHFQTPYKGWVVGRLESPNGGPSVGVMLKTADGGLKWEEVGLNVLPGLHVVRFFDEKNGVVCGDGSDAFPSGIFATKDGGVTWRAAPGPRVPSWRAADFGYDAAGIIGGAWSKLGVVELAAVNRGASPDVYRDADTDPLSGRAIHGVKMGQRIGQPEGDSSFAVGDGGVVLVSRDRGRRWGSVNLGLSPATLASCDFKCVAAAGSHVWVAGRPGSFVLHSPDGGKTWEVQKTNLSAPVNGMQFLDETTGWLVGDLGTIAATADGGKTWKVQRVGGQRAAALFLHAHGRSTPLGAVALLGHREGYLCAAVGVMAADPLTADPRRAGDDARLRRALRLAGGVSGETVWAFPLPAHAEGLPPRDLMASWDRAHGGKANDQLLRQAVLALRVWQPEVVVTDVVATDARPADVLVLHAAKEAFKQAADPNCFPEQIADLGLKPWAAKKLYALSPEDPAAPVRLDLTEFDTRLADSPKDFAEPAVRILGDDSPAPGRRCFKLLAHRLQGAEAHAGLMDGLDLGRGGAARRPEPAAGTDLTLAAERRNAAQARRQLEGLATIPDTEFGGAEKVIGALGTEMKQMPDDVAARTAFVVGTQFARAGKWAEAREVFALLTEQYPGHPLAVDAYRWLLRYHASTEARRRVEIQQKLAFGRVSFEPVPGAARRVIPAGGSAGPVAVPTVTEDAYRLYDQNMILKWHQACLDYEPKLAAFGPVYARDPAAWLSFLAARRQVGRHADAEVFVRDYFKHTPGAAALAPGGDPWRDCLAAELWLSDRGAIPIQPKPLGYCRFTETRPFLDGKLDDPCWQDLKPLPLKVVAAAGGTADEGKAFADGYKTEAKFAYDDRFLYVAVSCAHPAGQNVPAAAKRGRDADLTGRDRVDIMLDMDRDYQTYYRFQVDHRGCLAEDCWGDKGWNPKYFVAFNPTETGWTAEFAIPMAELAGDRPGTGRTWAVNVSRVVPGKGVQAWSGPADGEPRPEGMGLLQFRSER
ncbi:MAG: hypothetical protein JWO38_6762 [Gemmataceae bacterium]|nr:hypothetical protein [Gemmataceae bacterium]